MMPTLLLTHDTPWPDNAEPCASRTVAVICELPPIATLSVRGLTAIEATVDGSIGVEGVAGSVSERSAAHALMAAAENRTATFEIARRFESLNFQFTLLPPRTSDADAKK